MYEQGASITTSKMMSLGDEFAIVMHIECEPSKLNSVQAALNDGTLRKEHGLDVNCRAVVPLPPEKKIVPKFVASVSFTGVDRPGLLFRLSDVLTRQGLSIEHLQTEQHRSKRGQPQLFTTSCHVCSSSYPDRAGLRQALKDLEAELDVKIVFDVIDARLHRTVTG
jgi:glycine cleavage system regulatory protein